MSKIYWLLYLRQPWGSLAPPPPSFSSEPFPLCIFWQTSWWPWWRPPHRSASPCTYRLHPAPTSGQPGWQTDKLGEPAETCHVTFLFCLEKCDKIFTWTIISQYQCLCSCCLVWRPTVTGLRSGDIVCHVSCVTRVVTRDRAPESHARPLSGSQHLPVWGVGWSLLGIAGTRGRNGHGGMQQEIASHTFTVHNEEVHGVKTWWEI